MVTYTLQLVAHQVFVTVRTPDLPFIAEIVGPFNTEDEATGWIAAQDKPYRMGTTARYAQGEV